MSDFEIAEPGKIIWKGDMEALVKWALEAREAMEAVSTPAHSHYAAIDRLKQTLAKFPEPKTKPN